LHHVVTLTVQRLGNVKIIGIRLTTVLAIIRELLKSGCQKGQWKISCHITHLQLDG